VWTSLDWLIARPFAHRGLHDAELGLIENTAGAVRAAIASDYGIEIDVQISADGGPWCITTTCSAASPKARAGSTA
jgi:glycerophosphoryl diester phosphodiesterase